MPLSSSSISTDLSDLGLLLLFPFLDLPDLSISARSSLVFISVAKTLATASCALLSSLGFPFPWKTSITAPASISAVPLFRIASVCAFFARVTSSEVGFQTKVNWLVSRPNPLTWLRMCSNALISQVLLKSWSPLFSESRSLSISPLPLLKERSMIGPQSLARQLARPSIEDLIENE